MVNGSDGDEVRIVSGRECGGCTLCCKVLSIAELDKPQSEWCRHCDIGRGCRIYDERPSECRNFYCGYLTWPAAGEHWYPARSKMVIVSELGGNRLAIRVDPARPNAWREEPYYSEIKHWARSADPTKMQIVVFIRNRAIVILPDEEVDLGLVGEDERIISGKVIENGRPRLRAMKLRIDDPRIAGMEEGVPFQMGGQQ